MPATGQKAFDMAFILAGGGSCAPSWDGTDPVSSDTQVASVINEVRSGGGDVIVSAGGYNGTKLGQVCSSAAATTAYVSGNVVSHNGGNWTANQWNYDEVSGGPSGAWNDGPC